MGRFYTREITMVDQECWVCGLPFGMPTHYRDEARSKSHTIYCPRGCKLSLGESEAAKLRQQLENRDRELEYQEKATKRANQRVTKERRSHAATKGLLTKTKKRVSNGVCPCCKRSFQQLARHMKGQHPEYTDGAQ
jgi:hypothetical protein